MSNAQGIITEAAPTAAARTAAGFDFGTANAAQRAAITATEGPLLVTAGPGTGKTFTLVKRVAYLVACKGADPRSIFVATYTEKAANELMGRITDELAACGVEIDPGEMYVGTFHSLCQRLTREHAEHSGRRGSYHCADDFDQQYLVVKNYRDRFASLPHFSAFPQYSARGDKLPVWGVAGRICAVADRLSEELVDLNALERSGRPEYAAYAEVARAYNRLLDETGWIDFAGMQTGLYNMLTGCPDLLRELNGQIRYVMVDEYQDTNYIQERIALLLAGGTGNICVVGDDDQAIYRFRGATVRNILEFDSAAAEAFGTGVRRVDLSINYRSEPGIVEFCGGWMERPVDFSWGGFRLRKHIEAASDRSAGSTAVARVDAAPGADWAATVADAIVQLRSEGVISDYNQVALLMGSLGNRGSAPALTAALEARGVGVYAPRANRFFDRKEVRLTIGILMRAFPQMPDWLHGRSVALPDGSLREPPHLSRRCQEYYEGCLDHARERLDSPELAPLSEWVDAAAARHRSLRASADYGLSGFIYQIFQFEPYRGCLSRSTAGGVRAQRQVRNLATFAQLVQRFEYLEGVQVLTPGNIVRTVERFFCRYLGERLYKGLGEYEDPVETAPSGCVPFLTIHQAKGLEFPVVVAASLDRGPWDGSDKVLQGILDAHGGRPAFEPASQTHLFDFWRQYYVAFSRARDLLILTCAGAPDKSFQAAYAALPQLDVAALAGRRLRVVKQSAPKPAFSFTADVALYQRCGLQYKFFRELGFPQVRAGATVFGSLVHQTVEDVHRAALRGEAGSITPESIEAWFNANCSVIERAERATIPGRQREAALREVMRYVGRREGRWDDIIAAEVPVGLAEDDYIIHGTIDLVQAGDGTVDLVDFKAEKKPKPGEPDPWRETYRKQLALYARLVEQTKGVTVRATRIHYLGDNSGSPEVVFERDDRAMEEVAAEFDEVAHRIMAGDYSRPAADRAQCRDCDFRHYCRGAGRI